MRLFSHEQSIHKHVNLQRFVKKDQQTKSALESWFSFIMFPLKSIHKIKLKKLVFSQHSIIYNLRFQFIYSKPLFYTQLNAVDMSKEQHDKTICIKLLKYFAHNIYKNIFLMELARSVAAAKSCCKKRYDIRICFS